MVFTQFGQYVIDGNDDLWIKEDMHEADETVFDDPKDGSTLRLCKWFKNQGLTCLDVKCSSLTIIVKCKNEDGKEVLYGIPF